MKLDWCLWISGNLCLINITSRWFFFPITPLANGVEVFNLGRDQGAKFIIKGGLIVSWMNMLKGLLFLWVSCRSNV